METTATTRTASSRLHAALAALRAIDLPPDAEAVRERRFGGGRNRAHPGCGRRCRHRRDDSAAARCRLHRARGRRQTLRRGAAAPRARIEPAGPVRPAGGLDSGARARSGASRSLAQNAAGRHRRCAPGRGAARGAAAENALRQGRRRRAAAQAGDRDPRGLCAARQPPRGMAGQMGTGGPGLSLSGTGAVQAHCGGA